MLCKVDSTAQLPNKKELFKTFKLTRVAWRLEVFNESVTLHVSLTPSSATSIYLSCFSIYSSGTIKPDGLAVELKMRENSTEQKNALVVSISFHLS